MENISIEKRNKSLGEGDIHSKNSATFSVIETLKCTLQNVHSPEKKIADVISTCLAYTTRKTSVHSKTRYSRCSTREHSKWVQFQNHNSSVQSYHVHYFIKNTTEHADHILYFEFKQQRKLKIYSILDRHTKLYILVINKNSTKAVMYTMTTHTNFFKCTFQRSADQQ